MNKNKYYGFGGSWRAIAILLSHTAIIFFLGTVLYLSRMYVALWLSAFLVLLWVPKNIVQMVAELRNPLLEKERKRAVTKRLVLVGALCLPYLTPSFLFADPLSDTGFRLMYGHSLQLYTMEFLQSEASRIKRNDVYSDGMIEITTLPRNIREHTLVHPQRWAFVSGTGKDRYLSLSYGPFLGGRPEVFLEIGGPNFVPGPSRFRDRARQLWPGVYVVGVDEM